MSLGASLTWNKFLNEVFFTNGFRGLKDTIKLYILAVNGKNPTSLFRENSNNLMFDYFSVILEKGRFFWNNPFKSFLVPYCPLNLCKRWGNSLEQILRKRCY